MTKVIAQELLEILACPLCKGSIQLIDGKLVCEKCKNQYPIVDGMPVMLPGKLK